LSLKIKAAVCQGFDLKTTQMVSSGLASKPMATVSPGLTSKLVVEGFLIWALKLMATVW
jgi:hypothetical protein